VLLWKSEARADRLLAQLAMSGLGAVGLTLLLPLVFLLASESFEPSGGSWVAGVLTALGVLSARDPNDAPTEHIARLLQGARLYVPCLRHPPQWHRRDPVPLLLGSD
jgi:hypothetical protein